MNSTKYSEIIYKVSARGLTKPMNNFSSLKVHLTLPVARQHQGPLKVRGELQPQDMFLDMGNCKCHSRATQLRHSKALKVLTYKCSFYFIIHYI